MCVYVCMCMRVHPCLCVFSSGLPHAATRLATGLTQRCLSICLSTCLSFFLGKDAKSPVNSKPSSPLATPRGKEADTPAKTDPAAKSTPRPGHGLQPSLKASQSQVGPFVYVIASEHVSSVFKNMGRQGNRTGQLYYGKVLLNSPVPGVQNRVRVCSDASERGSLLIRFK